MFELLAKTGARLSIGFDHCSDTVLNHMKKLYFWDDCENFILQAERYNVLINIAMWIVGYPTGTEHDFWQYEKLICLLKNNKHTIKAHSVIPCSINRNSKLLQHVSIDWHRPNDWIGHNGLDKATRNKRKKWVDDKLSSLQENYYKHETTVIRSNK